MKPKPTDRCVCGHDRRDHKTFGCYHEFQSAYGKIFNCFCESFRPAKKKGKR